MISFLYLLFAVILLGFIVMVHEFGHYIFARITGVKVEEFAVGMGPKIWGTRKGEIDYSLRAIPVGGFCRFVGEDEESDSPDAFANQKRWKRFLILFFGAGMNFVLAYVAIVLFLGFFGQIVEPLPVISGVVDGGTAQIAGIMPGDVITQVNDTEITYDEAGLNKMIDLISGADSNVTLQIERDGNMMSLEVPVYKETDVASSNSRSMIGVTLGKETKAGFWEAFKASGNYFIYYATAMIDGLRQMVFGEVGLDQTMGPVGLISSIGEQTRESGWQAIFSMTALISLNLGIVNLLPLPALDGGRLVFLLVEMVRRKPIPPEKEGMVHAIGLILLFGLIIVITYKDIARLIMG
ncbi:MAG: PDZ domain-containing protein [Clostridiales bacterium]|nr:PDZ domain-containing protein [Clostridiales bacterium]